jgi:hypothetical protein
MSVPKLSLLVGSHLIVLGIAAFLLTDRQSVTALIPAVFGLLMTGVGGLALELPRLLPALSRANALLAVLGVAGTFRALLKLPALLAGQAERPAAVITQIIMCGICLSYSVLWWRASKARHGLPPK